MAASFQIDPDLFDALSGVMPLDLSLVLHSSQSDGGSLGRSRFTHDLNCDEFVEPLSPVADPELSRRELRRRSNPAFDHGPAFRSRESGHVAAPRPETTPLQVIERGEADRIRKTCHGLTLWRRRIHRAPHSIFVSR